MLKFQFVLLFRSFHMFTCICICMFTYGNVRVIYWCACPVRNCRSPCSPVASLKHLSSAPLTTSPNKGAMRRLSKPQKHKSFAQIRGLKPAAHISNSRRRWVSSFGPCSQLQGHGDERAPTWDKPGHPWNPSLAYRPSTQVSISDQACSLPYFYHHYCRR